MIDSDGAPESTPRSLGLLLTDGFALMSYAAVVEPFRAANVLAGQTLYRWTHVSPDGAPVRASNGASIVADERVGRAEDYDAVFAFAAGDPGRFVDAATFAWLRELARRQVVLAGISGGPFLLARAGLLDGYRATIHWDHRAALREEFPLLEIDAGLYVIDRRRVTCAGGTAGLDLAIEMIKREQGHSLALRVGEWFIRGGFRSADEPQRMSLRERYGLSDDRLLKVLAHMEASVEEPAPRSSLASIAGMSLRQLERLFLRDLAAGVADTYLTIRLDQAGHLVRTTGLSITAIALQCGFRSSSHFSRAFKQRFGRAPGEARRRAAAP